MAKLREMRLAIVAALTVLVALPALAAGVDPGALVVQASDVPAGYRLDPAESGLRTNTLEAREYPATRPIFARWRRVTGYQAMYRRGQSRIEARVDLFHGADGAQKMLAWVDREATKAGISGQRRARSRVGAEGWIHWSRGGYTLISWRQGRVFGGVFGEGIARARVIGLAGAQQRRIASALR